MKTILQAYEKGDYYPVWGTCLGFQELSALVAEILVTTDARVWDQSLPLNISKGEHEALERDSFSLFYW
jgi:gamma-glutamyl hydrolase